MAGTNDMVQQYQESTAPARLSSLISQILNDDPTATLLVANLIIGTNANIAAGEPAYNAAIPGIVQSEDDPVSNLANGTQLIIWDCNGGTNQQWAVPST